MIKLDARTLTSSLLSLTCTGSLIYLLKATVAILVVAEMVYGGAGS